MFKSRKGDHFYHEIRNGGDEFWEPLLSSISKWEPAQLRVISAQFSAIKAPLIPEGYRSGGGVASVYPAPSIISAGSTIENSGGIMEHNWSTIESSQFDFYIQKWRESGETFPASIANPETHNWNLTQKKCSSRIWELKIQFEQRNKTNTYFKMNNEKWKYRPCQSIIAKN